MRKYVKKAFTFVSLPGEDKYSSCAAEVQRECTKRFLEKFQKSHKLFEDDEFVIKCLEDGGRDCKAPIISDYATMLENVGDYLVIKAHNENIIPSWV